MPFHVEPAKIKVVGNVVQSIMVRHSDGAVPFTVADVPVALSQDDLDSIPQTQPFFIEPKSHSPAFKRARLSFNPAMFTDEWHAAFNEQVPFEIKIVFQTNPLTFEWLTLNPSCDEHSPYLLIARVVKALIAPAMKLLSWVNRIAEKFRVRPRPTAILEESKAANFDSEPPGVGSSSPSLGGGPAVHREPRALRDPRPLQ